MRLYPLVALLHLVLAKFPTNFEFGVSTAAYQIEGGWLEGGKSLSTWDNLVHSGAVVDGSTGDVADDSFHKYHEDIALMKEYGIKNYRMSVSWSRIVPRGNKGTPVNMLAIEHYRRQFQALISVGITPYVTLYHNVMPANLYINGTGYTDPDFVEDFVYYGDVCFKYFGDLVKYWFTFNEPWCQAVFESCTPEEVNTKPYLITHAILLAHAKTADVYKKQYQPTQKGKIGIVLNTEVYYPKNPRNWPDVLAAVRARVFQLDWYAHPLFTGEYPDIMKEIVKDRLPKFTEEEKKLLNNSLDFYAFNSYFPQLAERGSNKKEGFEHDRNTKFSAHPSWRITDMGWGVYPKSFYDILIFTHEMWLQYTNLEVFIAESGTAVKERNMREALDDKLRVDYLQTYMEQMTKAMDKGMNVTKFFVWSLLDNFEWGSGLSKKFGLVRVEYDRNQKRVPKKSIAWYYALIRDFTRCVHLNPSYYKGFWGFGAVSYTHLTLPTNREV
eukprot:TRINITY_DN852_c0_g1_i1.p1 TRINITY_DN852_c0_g1~~TRINITY_DN852_c0_g1_i1.p1  ORF type:complete len:497 (+),score=119.50 TRINITY_DN852_c0_g1_i1:207-1697(+)